MILNVIIDIYTITTTRMMVTIQILKTMIVKLNLYYFPNFHQKLNFSNQFSVQHVFKLVIFTMYA